MQKGKPAKKYSQAGRVHDIIRLIEARFGITVDELAEETGRRGRRVAVIGHHAGIRDCQQLAEVTGLTVDQGRGDVGVHRPVERARSGI